MLKVFASFAEEDRALVGKLQHALSALNEIKLYRYDHDPKPGITVATKVREAIAEADVVVVLLTPHGATSAWIHEEIGAANALQKHIVPMVAPGAPVPPMLAGLERITLDPDNVSISVARTANALERMRTRKIQRELAVLAGLALLLVAICK